MKDAEHACVIEGRVRNLALGTALISPERLTDIRAAGAHPSVGLE
jgi:hypothetical protein